MSIADNLNSKPADEPASKGRADVDPEGVEVKGATVGEAEHALIAAGDWTPVFALFKLDPAAFEVVDETVRMSTWQQSKRTDTGDRDVVQLYAYSFRARRLLVEHIRPAVVESWRAELQDRNPFRSDPGSVRPNAGTYLVLVADPQLGKKGTDEAVANWRRGVDGHIEHARGLADRGLVERVHIAFMGDETENVVNSYGNQPHTVELNRSRQLELDYDMRVWTLDRALAVGRPVSASSVISNHGEWTRNASKEPVTSANDNASTYIAREVRKLYDRLAPFTGQRIDWTIGETHPGVLVDLSGVRAYFSHGYVEKGRGTSTETRTRSAIERQILGRTDDLGAVPLWFMAHYHHNYSNEFEGRSLFGCPAIEAERSSEYMLDQYGVWSPPGVLGMVVGSGFRRGWAHLNVE